MTMIFNGAELEEVVFNGVDCDKVYMNGALVFEKVSDGVLFSGTITVATADLPWGLYYGYISTSLDEDLAAGGLTTAKIGGGLTGMLGVMWGLFDSPFYILDIIAVGYLPSPIECRVTIGGFVADMYLGSESPDMPAGGNITFPISEYNKLPKSGTHPILIEAIA